MEWSTELICVYVKHLNWKLNTLLRIAMASMKIYSVIYFDSIKWTLQRCSCQLPWWFNYEMHKKHRCCLHHKLNFRRENKTTTKNNWKFYFWKFGMCSHSPYIVVYFVCIFLIRSTTTNDNGRKCFLFNSVRLNQVNVSSNQFTFYLKTPQEINVMIIALWSGETLSLFLNDLARCLKMKWESSVWGNC